MLRRSPPAGGESSPALSLPHLSLRLVTIDAPQVTSSRRGEQPSPFPTTSQPPIGHYRCSAGHLQQEGRAAQPFPYHISASDWSLSMLRRSPPAGGESSPALSLPHL